MTQILNFYSVVNTRSKKRGRSKKGGLSCAGLLLTVVVSCCVASLGYAQNFYPDDIGNTWVLHSTDGPDVRTVTIKGPDDLNGQQVKRIEDGTNPDSLSQYFVKPDSDGLKLYRAVVSLPIVGEVTLDYSPPQIFLPIPIALGTTWTLESEVNTPLTGEIGINIRAEVVGIEDVTVPVGTFEDCLKIAQDTAARLGIIELKFTNTMWLAPDVGLVKSISTSDEVFELIRLDIAPKKEPTAVRPKGKLATTWATIKRH